jgi:hypothetical protein
MSATSKNQKVLDHFERIKLDLFAKQRGRLTYESCADSALMLLKKEFSSDRIYAALIEPLLLRDIKREVDRRCIEQHDDSQGQLFSESFLDARVKLDTRSFTCMRVADLEVIELISKRKAQNLKMLQASNERWLKRREILLESGMRDDPLMTVGQAVKRYETASTKPSRESAGVSISL